MCEKLYDFMNFLDRKIHQYPFDMHHTVEMDLDLYKFGREVGFIPESGIFKFKGVTFVLG